MRYKNITIGQCTVSLAAFALGTHIFGMDRIADSLNETDSAKILYQYLEGGGNVIDTARTYGRSEEYIGKCFASDPSLRKKLFLITKGGHDEIIQDGKLYVHVRFGEKELRKDVEKSLETLRTDKIDLYFLHKDNPEIPVPEIVETLESFKREGLIGAYGASNWTVSRIDAANRYAKEHGFGGFAASEIAFSPYVGSTVGWGENELCVEMDREEYAGYQASQLPVFAYNSQAYGFFYKNFDKPDNEVRASAENLEKLRRFREICRKNSLTPHQVMFGFFAGLDIPAIPVATSTSKVHLAEMLAGCDTELTQSDARQLLL